MATASTLDVVDTSGKKTGSVNLPAAIFDVQTNVPLIHQVVVAQLAAARQGTHKTKNRGEVSGAGRKPFKQKGTGRARQGSIRAPEHRGGGVVHGPTPRDYSQRTPKKMIAAALLGAISDRVRGDRLHIVEAFGDGKVPSTKGAAQVLAAISGKHVLIVLDRGDELGAISDRARGDRLIVLDSFGKGDVPSTKGAAQLLSSVKGKHVLVVLERDDVIAAKSVRNLPAVHVIWFDQLNAYDVLVSDDIVFTKGAFDAFVAAKSGATSAAKTDTVKEEAGE